MALYPVEDEEEHVLPTVWENFEQDRLDAQWDEDLEELPSEQQRRRMARTPTTQQVVDHEDSNHAIGMEWCWICRAARSTGAQHRRISKEAKEAEENQKICSDYFFMNSDEGSQPMFALKFVRTGRISATALEAKGLTQHGMSFFG